MTKGILRSLNRQKSLYLEHLTHKTDVSTNKYKTYRNHLKKIIRSSKQTYFLNKCKAFKQDSRKLWQLINNTLNKKPIKNVGIESLKIDNIPRYDAKSITTEFCTHFAQVGKTYANKLPPPTTPKDVYIKKIERLEHSLFLTPTYKIEINNLIRDLPIKTSSGHDNISNTLLKAISQSILEPLEIIFNRSLSEGYFPSKMKNADVIPLYKTKQHDESNNYRPISLLLTISKILEKIIYKRTYQFLEETDQIYKSQYGFRSSHSCENAIQELVSEIIKGKQDNLYMLALFLDLSKVFDSLEHTVLLEKLERYSIRGVSLEWYKSYLKNRSIRVKCKVTSTGMTEYSDYQNIEFGTQQGSCLGPLIFLIFTNDLYKHAKYSSTILFADNTTLYKTHRNLEYLKFCLEHDLNHLLDWFHANKLTLNLTKTVCVLFQQNQKHKDIILEVNNLKIHNEPETKFLGMWLDQNLNWNSHIQKLIVKLRRKQGLLKCAQNFPNKEAKKLVYHAHIESHIRYGLIIWGNNASTQQINKIRRLQSECLTLICGKKAGISPSNERILDISKMITLENMKFGYKLINNKSPVKTSELCRLDHNNKSLEKTHNYSTRNKRVPKPPKKNE